MRPLVPSQMIQSCHLPRAAGLSQEPPPAGPAPPAVWQAPSTAPSGRARLGQGQRDAPAVLSGAHCPAGQVARGKTNFRPSGISFLWLL